MYTHTIFNGKNHLPKKHPHKLFSLCGAKSARAHKQKPLCDSKRTTLIAFAHNPFAHNPRAQAFTLGAQLRTNPAHKPWMRTTQACAHKDFFPLNIVNKQRKKTE